MNFKIKFAILPVKECKNINIVITQQRDDFISFHSLILVCAEHFKLKVFSSN